MTGRSSAVRTALVALCASALVGLGGAAVADDDIVHGDPTTTAEHPWQAQLVIQNRFLCGGTLISPTVVLTAAHCLAEVTAPSQVVVSVGRDATTSGGVTQVATTVRVDPAYHRRHLAGDWAYVVLPAPVPSQFTPVQLAGADEAALWAPGAKATVTGYGTTRQNAGHPSSTLREVTFPTLPDSACAGAYGRIFDPHSMLCAGDPRRGEDSCQGDSGGPLVVRADDGSFRLAGIVSFGHGCGERRFPGVYTRIADPTLSAALVGILNADPATAGYPYLGSGQACGTATTTAAKAAHRLDAAQRRLHRDQHRHGLRGHARAHRLHLDKLRAKAAGRAAKRAGSEQALACG